MTEGIRNIILSAIGVIVTGLASYFVTKITQCINKWTNNKIINDKTANYALTITNLVATAVKETYQVFVQTLKEDGTFGGAAQKEALRRSLESVKTKCTQETLDYITNNFGDIDTYLTGLIEAQIYTLKNISETAPTTEEK